jgi:hypothetical protein
MSCSHRTVWTLVCSNSSGRKKCNGGVSQWVGEEKNNQTLRPLHFPTGWHTDP